MRILSTRTFLPFCIVIISSLILSTISFSQIVIRDTVTITPKNTHYSAMGVVATTPVVDVFFLALVDAFDGSYIQTDIGDTTWTNWAYPCTGLPGAVMAVDMGIYPEDGSPIGKIRVGSCFPRNLGVVTYEPYISPSYGGSTTLGVTLRGG